MRVPVLRLAIPVLLLLSACGDDVAEGGSQGSTDGATGSASNTASATDGVTASASASATDGGTDTDGASASATEGVTDTATASGTDTATASGTDTATATATDGGTASDSAGTDSTTSAGDSESASASASDGTAGSASDGVTASASDSESASASATAGSDSTTGDSATVGDGSGTGSDTSDSRGGSGGATSSAGESSAGETGMTMSSGPTSAGSSTTGGDPICEPSGGNTTGGTSGTTSGGEGGGGGGIVPVPEKIYCEGKLYQCGNLIDDDNDGYIDLVDPECTGPCDNNEATFATGIPGDNVDPCKQDCFFDGDSGKGNDGCEWNLKCDSANPGGLTCPYDPGYNNCPGSQPAKCLNECHVPNGCDCFGCCAITTGSGVVNVFLGSGGACSIDNLDACEPCTQNPACDNPCGECELCLGEQTLPPGCEPTCDSGIACESCGNGADTCPAGMHCLTGCCFED